MGRVVQRLPLTCSRETDEPREHIFPEQASLVETVTDVRPGVTVQEMAFPEDRAAAAEGSATLSPEIVRMKAGPAELQVPGRLSRSAYKVMTSFMACFRLHGRLSLRSISA